MLHIATFDTLLSTMFLSTIIVVLMTSCCVVDVKGWALTRCNVDQERGEYCWYGCLWLYQAETGAVMHKCYESGLLSKTLNADNNECKRDVEYGGVEYKLACACTEHMNCNTRSERLIYAACQSQYPIDHGEPLYGRIDTCQCARNNPIACWKKQGKINRLCSGDQRRCPSNVPNYS